MAWTPKSSRESRIFGYMIIIVFSTIVTMVCSTARVPIDPFACPSQSDNPYILLVSEQKTYPMDYLKDTWPPFKELKFQCKAPYPIEWDFSGYHRPTDIRFYAEVKVDDIFQTTKKCYTVTMATHGWGTLETRSGNYTCRGLNENTKKSTSVYKFIQDREDSIFHSMKFLKLNTDGATNLVIPCASNVPSLNATLLSVVDQHAVKPNEGGLNGTLPISEISTDINVSYDDKQGFNISAAKSAMLAGKYMCTGVNNNVTDAVEIVVNDTPLPEVFADPKGRFVTFSRGKVGVTCKSNEDVIIRLANPIPGVNLVSGNSAALEERHPGEKYRYSVYAEFSNTQTDVKGDIVCSNKKTGAVLMTWTFDTFYSCVCNWTRDTGSRYEFHDHIIFDRAVRSPSEGKTFRVKDRDLQYPTEPRGQIICSSPSSMKVNATFLACSNPTECRIQTYCHQFDECPLATVYTPREDDDNWSSTEEKSPSTKIDMRLRSGELRCLVGDYVHTVMAVASLDAVYFDEIPGDGNESLRIVGPENHAFPGDTMIFSCQAAKYQLHGELKWAFKFKNQSVQFIDIPDKRDDKTGIDTEKIYRTSYITIPSADVSALMCFAPVWNTNEWQNHSFPLFMSDLLQINNNSLSSCPSDSSPVIIIQRNSSVSAKRVRVPHLASNTTISIFEPVDQMRLICRANYPIEWAYDGIKVNGTKVNKVVCGSTKKVYESILEINNLQKENTGNYTCGRTLQAESTRTFLYVYVVGDGETSFIHEGHHVQIVKQDADPWVTVPCRVSNPTAKPYLFIDHEETGTVERLSFSEVTYDPRWGFRMDVSRAPKPVTTFICSMDENGSDLGMLITLQKREAVGLDLYTSSSPSHGSNAAFITVTFFLVLLVIGLLCGLVIMYRKLKQGLSRDGSIEDSHKMEDADVFAAYENEVRVQNDDTENIVDGYHRF